jgi:prephenate dehydratase/chorismate mutase/prephenate dehydratase
VSGQVPSIGFQGELGAYSEEAVLGYFGPAVEPRPLPTFRAVCAGVEAGELAAGVIPTENSLAGSVGEALDALSESELVVVGELLLPVRHRLLGVDGAVLGGIRRVASHPQALAQCDAYLAASGWQLIPAEDTAGSARALAETGDRTLAVIASARAAERYGLVILADDLVAAGNVTRFAIVVRPGSAAPPAEGPLAPPADAPRSTLVIFETQHRPGALHAALGAFADAGVNLTRIESRPTRRASWEYRFVVQLEGEAALDPVRSALASLADHAQAIRLLGSFPSADAGRS